MARTRSYDPLDLNPITLVEEMVMERIDAITETISDDLFTIPVGLPMTRKEMAVAAEEGMSDDEAMRTIDTQGYTGLADIRRRRAKEWLKRMGTQNQSTEA